MARKWQLERVWRARVKCTGEDCYWEGEWTFDLEDFPDGLEAVWNDPEFVKQYEPECGHCGAPLELLEAKKSVIRWSLRPED